MVFSCVQINILLIHRLGQIQHLIKQNLFRIIYDYFLFLLIYLIKLFKEYRDQLRNLELYSSLGVILVFRR